MSSSRFDEAARARARARLDRFAEEAQRLAGETTSPVVATYELFITDRAVYACALLRDPTVKPGQAPASNASIEAMAPVTVTEADGVKECSICLEEMGVGGEVREMPCKHGFHSACIKKWLGIHGSCPVCRYTMPGEEEEEGEKEKNDDGVSGGGTRAAFRSLLAMPIMWRDNGSGTDDPVLTRWISSNLSPMAQAD